MKTISDHILDIAQNSVIAGATVIEIMVEEDLKNNLYTLKIKDNGCGMNDEILRKAADPFFTSRKTRKVGLGLALLKHNAEQANGSFKLWSEEGKGTAVEATFELSNIDRPPLGQIGEVYMLMLLSGNKYLAVKYRHKTEELGEIWLQHREIRNAINELIRNNLKDIRTTFN